MSEQVIIDSLEFARSGQALRGRIPVAHLSRLQDCLHNNAGEVAYVLTGHVNERGKPVLHCAVSGELQLKCQRCLGALVYPLNTGSELELVANEQELAEDALQDDDADRIIADTQLDVLALVEEEILLGLPLSPRHAEIECRAGAQDEAAKSARPNPFAVLAELKQRKH